MVACDQGDQIGRIFTHLSTVNFGQFFENDKSNPKVCVNFTHGNSCVLILTKMGWAKFWSIFPNSSGHPTCE
jgi:hypothetical protein